MEKSLFCSLPNCTQSRESKAHSEPTAFFIARDLLKYTFGANDVQTQFFTDLTQKVREAIYKLRSKCKFTNAFSAHDLSEVYIADC